MATVTATLTELVEQTVTRTVAAASTSSTLRAAPQGGILEGGNPTHYDPRNPIILFIIQAGIIILFCRLLHWPLSKLRQPRVIAEVIGGILLGPSVMGRIPGFSDTIFPTASIPNLSLVANLGLVLFLFLVGLEVDLRYFFSNWKVAVSVGTAGMALPFGLGCAIAWGLYQEFRDEEGLEPISFGTYMLFIGIAMAITAFPVLCRILTELNLLGTPVGIITLSAGVSNDVVGWILLALCVALVNAGSGLTALWVLLTCVGYALFLFLAVQPAFLWLLHRNRAIQDGPSQSVIVLTLLIALTSAFFTGVIGVHPIFGAFMAGLICPHDGGFAIKVTEKIEDLVSALFLPLYFALSGLSTDIGLLDDGITWAYVVGVIAIAFIAKFTGGTLGAKVNGMVWREAFTIGALMSCKGLVELIVLNIGLQARILSTRTFTIFVIMALITTFATTPLVQLLYPPWYQKKLEAWKRGEIDWNTGAPLTDGSNESDTIAVQKSESTRIRNLLVYLRLDNMPTTLAFVSLLGHKSTQTTIKEHPSLAGDKTEEIPDFQPRRRVEVHGVRLVQLTDRGSTVMQVTEVDEYSAFDPVLNAFRVLGQMFNLAVSGEVSVVPEDSFADTLVNKADEESSDLLLLPWSETGSLSETQIVSLEGAKNKLLSGVYGDFIQQALDAAHCNSAVFINKGFSGTLKQRKSSLHRTVSAMSIRSQRDNNATLLSVDRSHHIFMPFFGFGPDDHIALRIVLQLAENPGVTATIVYYEVPDQLLTAAPTNKVVEISEDSKHAQSHTSEAPGCGGSSDSVAFFAMMRKSLPAELASRVLFDTRRTSDQLQGALALAQAELAQNPKNGGDLVVVGRHVNHFRGNGNAAACLGAAADTFAASGIRASLLVVQAKRNGLE